MQKKLFIATDVNVESIQDVIEAFSAQHPELSGRLDKTREELRDLSIYMKYQREKKKRKGESQQIREELAEEFFNTKTAINTIHNIIYRKGKQGV